MVAGMIWNESKLLHRNTQCQPDAVQKPLISSPISPGHFTYTHTRCRRHVLSLLAKMVYMEASFLQF